LIESLKLLKLRKPVSLQKSGGYVYTSFRGYENHSFKFNAELKSHYELVGRDLARFYESKEDYKTKKLKILFQYGQRARLLKLLLDDLVLGK
jgi:hypothetical protein